MNYTNDQTDALADLSLFYSSNRKTHTLDGAGGTGKTTILKAFINSLPLSKNKIAVSAPTHKAKKVIQSATGFRAHTIQSLLGLRPDVDIANFNPNSPQFSPIGEETIKYYKIIVLDEASMINKEAYDMLVNKAEKYNIKILFTGDALQLPPVGEDISLVFNGNSGVSTLNEIVRQSSDNPLSSVLSILREDIINNTNNALNMLSNPVNEMVGDLGYRVQYKKAEEKTDKFGINLLSYYQSTEYLHDKDHIKFLSYTNKSVESWTNALRNQLITNAVKRVVTTNELLVGYNSIIENRTNTYIVQNSEEYIVTKVEYSESSFKIKGYNVTLETLDRDISNVFIVDTTDVENLKLFTEVYLEKLRNAKANRGSYWRTYYNFKNKHLVLSNIFNNANQNYLNGTKDEFLCKKDLYYSYGSTIHKSQGSTYKNVAINLSDITKIRNIKDRNKLFYVAMSRASNSVLIGLDGK